MRRQTQNNGRGVSSGTKKGLNEKSTTTRTFLLATSFICMIYIVELCYLHEYIENHRIDKTDFFKSTFLRKHTGMDHNVTKLMNEVLNATDDDMIKKILNQSGIPINETTVDGLPSSADVEKLYGSKPLIHGLETCEAFRKSVPAENRYIGPAGMFNTGTNVLYDLLKHNCEMPFEHRSARGIKIRWMVPWGKHSPESFRLHHVAPNWGVGIVQENVLPVVTVKDPYTWMGSMCRHHYAALWMHEIGHCPNLVSSHIPGKTFPVTVVYNKTRQGHYPSLIGLWNDWNRAYSNVTYPRLIIRFEDLVFRPEEVTREVCKCGGGFEKSKEFIINADSAKALQKGHANSNGLLEALKRYGRTSLRIEGLTSDDIDYAKKMLDSKLMNSFQYTYPKKENM